jgi:hydrogenase maturation protein HypF
MADTIRKRFDLRGQVQGVGFRPYVYRLAAEHQLGGYVANNNNGAVIEIEGPATRVAAFERDLVNRLPPLAHVTELTRHVLTPLGDAAFRIRASEANSSQRPEVAPDAATCADCRRELFDPADRRHRYPFINCTNCGPRYSIIRGLPYDRRKTTMAVFQMCPACQREYDDPGDRRFHAQPNACPVCGPQLRLRRSASFVGRGPGEGLEGAAAVSAVSTAASLLQQGAILAIKGIGGYHLACRADREDVVQRLRERKLRDGKPLAMMIADVAAARRLCMLTPADEDTLRSTAAPIVLAPQAPGNAVAPSVAPGCRDFGVMLPYTPIHHLLFEEGLGPLVMTSANLAGQPLTYRDDDALAELSDVADAFLLHDREIFRPIDDSVVFTFRDEVVPIRRARGYAPRPIRLPVLGPGIGRPTGPPYRILAVGGELKSTVCLLHDTDAILSEHLGDLTRPETFRHFVRAIDQLKDLCGFEPALVACDLHPQYLATEYARRLGLPVIAVQHHHAHIAGVMAEWGAVGPVVGLSCDGTGYGSDGAVWGCEVLLCERGDVERIGHLEYFPLVGGDRAALETWRPAAALLRAAGEDTWREPIPAGDRRALEQQIAGGVSAPLTSSLGRVFDAVSFLLGLCSFNRHEAEAAMALELAAATEPPAVEPFAFDIADTSAGLQLSLLPTIRDIVVARRRGDRIASIAARFHETVAQMLAAAAGQACDKRGVTKVAVSGGCFANRRLLTRLVDLLEADGRQVLYHRQIPPGDGGLALGQAFVAAWRLTGP